MPRNHIFLKKYYVYHINFCCRNNIAFKLHGEGLDISSQYSTMVYEKIPCTAMPCAGSVEGDTESEQENSA